MSAILNIGNASPSLSLSLPGQGMEFGIWFEPEMVNPDSELYRTHPDWVLRIKGRPLLLSRHQLVLDLTRPEVGDYLFARLDHGRTSRDRAGR